jgi:cytochrome c553
MKRVLSRMLVASGLVLGASVALPSFAAEGGPAKPDVARGGKLFEQGDDARGIVSCASCHGAAGNSSIGANPMLAGQHSQYLYKQLLDFKTLPDAKGPNRPSAVMGAMVTSLTDADMRDISAYLAAQTLDKPAAASDKDLVDLGQQIWRGGIAAKGVPACAACHAANGVGMPGQYPYLGGQFSEYIAQQLGHFRTGERPNNAAMHDIALRLTDAEIKAVSDYAAGLR